MYEVAAVACAGTDLQYEETWRKTDHIDNFAPGAMKIQDSPSGEVFETEIQLAEKDKMIWARLLAVQRDGYLDKQVYRFSCRKNITARIVHLGAKLAGHSLET